MAYDSTHGKKRRMKTKMEQFKEGFKGGKNKTKTASASSSGRGKLPTKASATAKAAVSKKKPLRTKLKGAKLTQYTRAEMADVSAAERSHASFKKRMGQKYSVRDQAKVRSNMERSITRRRKSGL